MKRHKKESITAQKTGPDPVVAFMAQAPFVEEDGIDDAAVKREELLHGGIDANAISEAIELMNLHHELK